MIIDDKDIARLRKDGIKVTTADGKQLVPKAPGKSELEHLRDISRALNQILDKPEAKQGEAPKVTVNTPAVTVNTPEPIRKWKFAISRDTEGRMKEIIATAAT
jgi:hypothetical protein